MAKKQNAENPLEIEFDLRPGLDMAKSVVKKVGEQIPTPENRARAAKQKYEHLQKRLEALKQEKQLLENIAGLEEEIRKLKQEKKKGGKAK